MNHNWLLIGHYGAGNTGDEMMLAGLASLCPPQLRQKLVVATRDPSQTPAIEALGLKHTQLHATSAISALRQYRGVILGGGTHFYDYYRGIGRWRHQLAMAKHVALYQAAARLGKPVFWAGVGVGPLETRLGQRLLRQAAAACTQISVRDQASYDTCRNLGVDAEKLVLGFDLAAACAPAPTATQSDSSGASVATEPSSILGASVMDLTRYRGFNGTRDEQIASMSQAFEHALEQNPKLSIRFFIFGVNRREPDNQITDAIAKRLNQKAPGRAEVVPHDASFDRILAQAQQCQWWLCTRFHSLLTAYLVNKPVLAIAYSRKVQDLCNELELPASSCLQPSQIQTASDLQQALQSLIQNPSHHQPKLTLKDAVQRAQASINMIQQADESISS